MPIKIDIERKRRQKKKLKSEIFGEKAACSRPRDGTEIKNYLGG